MTQDFVIQLDDLSDARVRDLIGMHLAAVREFSPPESIHALPIEALLAPGMSVWSVWLGDSLAGCGALRELDRTHGEVKSMRTAPEFLRRGVARALMDHIMAVARGRGYQRLSLETGAMAAFEPARALYRRLGFVDCAPFGEYHEDRNSVFMTREID